MYIAFTRLFRVSRFNITLNTTTWNNFGGCSAILAVMKYLLCYYVPVIVGFHNSYFFLQNFISLWWYWYCAIPMMLNLLVGNYWKNFQRKPGKPKARKARQIFKRCRLMPPLVLARQIIKSEPMEPKILG